MEMILVLSKALAGTVSLESGELNEREEEYRAATWKIEGSLSRRV